MEKEKLLIKIFPFALYRIDELEDYLTEMYQSGLLISKILFGFILVFKPIKKAKDDLRCIVLTEHSNSRARRIKWDDGAFLKKRNSSFHKGDGFQTQAYAFFAETKYSVHLTRVMTSEDYEALKQYRKKRIVKINILKFLESLLILIGSVCIVLNLLNLITPIF